MRRLESLQQPSRLLFSQWLCIIGDLKGTCSLHLCGIYIEFLNRMQ